MLWPSFKNFVVIFMYEFLNSAILYTKLQRSQSPVKVLSFFFKNPVCTSFLKNVQTGQISRWTNVKKEERNHLTGL